MFIPISDAQSHAVSTDTALPLVPYMYVLSLFIIACAILFFVVTFAIRGMARDVAIASAVSPLPRLQTQALVTNYNLKNTTPTQASYLNSEQKTEVSINGQPVPIPQDKDAHVTVPVPGGQAVIDSQIHSTQTGDGSSSVTSRVEVHSTSSSEVVIEDTQ